MKTRIGMLCFTGNGCRSMKELLSGFLELGYEAEGYLKTEYSSVEDCGNSRRELCMLSDSAGQWTRQGFENLDCLVFIGAVGIAVRLIAPYIKEKTGDPAVLAVDETGKFVIPLLSGHLGGANRLALEAASILDAVPVITTATDLNHVFAVDLFAQKNDLLICDMQAAKKVSASLLAGKPVGYFSEFPWEGELPRGLLPNQDTALNLYVTIHYPREQGAPEDQDLRLIKRAVTLGIGCRKDTSADQIETAVEQFLSENHIDVRAVESVASIDIKKEEPGLLALAEKLKIKFIVFSAKELASAEGAFAESQFVKEVTGVSNVCERAALLASGKNSHLLVGKTIYPGITVAAAVRRETVVF